MVVSGEEQRDSVTHTHVSVLPQNLLPSRLEVPVHLAPQLSVEVSTRFSPFGSALQGGTVHVCSSRKPWLPVPMSFLNLTEC